MRLPRLIRMKSSRRRSNESSRVIPPPMRGRVHGSVRLNSFDGVGCMVLIVTIKISPCSSSSSSSAKMYVRLDSWTTTASISGMRTRAVLTRRTARRGGGGGGWFLGLWARGKLLSRSGRVLLLLTRGWCWWWW